MRPRPGATQVWGKPSCAVENAAPPMNSQFHQILGNNLVANITNFTVWFAVTFWVFLETRSVFATGMIAGIFLVFTADFGFWFGRA